MKRILAVLLSVLLLASLAACGGQTVSESSTESSQSSESSEASESSEPTEEPTEEPTAEPTEETSALAPINVVALKGPTGIGMAGLFGETEGTYNIQLAAAPDDITGLITTGAVDIAAVPANLAAVLYNKTEGGVKMLAVNTLGVLYIVERGDSIQSVADLEGKTIYATGQGSTPEYALNYILEKNGVTCDVEYLTEHSELATKLVSGECDVALLPQPYVTTVLQKDDSLRIALDMTAEWDAASEGQSQLVMGALIIRTEFLEQNPDAVAKFLEEYAASVDFVNSDPAAAAAICEENDIIAASVAEAAIPYCNIVCLTGEDMKSAALDFLNVLYGYNPASVGGAEPSEDLFYIAK